MEKLGGLLKRLPVTGGTFLVGAAAWLAQHLWWHYEYGQDLVKEFYAGKIADSYIKIFNDIAVGENFGN